MKIVPPSVTLLDITHDPVSVIERAARNCYQSHSSSLDNRGKLVRQLLASGHLSMFRFASATFEIVTDRGVTHELVRHQHADFAQESTRYCNYSGDRFGNQITVCLDENDQENHGLREVFGESAERGYFGLLDAGSRPQMARDLLPTMVKSAIVVRANFQEWLWILDVRRFGRTGLPHPRMLAIMEQVRSCLASQVPEVFSQEANEIRWRGEIDRLQGMLAKGALS